MTKRNDKSRQQKRQRRTARRKATLKQRPKNHPAPVANAGPKKTDQVLPKLEDATVASLLADTKNWPEEILRAVGFEIQVSRKVTPMTEDDVGGGAEYDDLVGIQYGLMDCKVGGFRIQAQPHRVGTSEAAKLADPNCHRCNGVGKWHVSRANKVGIGQGGKPIINDLEYEVNCECAEKAYKAQHKNLLIDGQLGEWILLEDLIVGLWEEPDVLSKVPRKPDDERLGGTSVPEVSEAGA